MFSKVLRKVKETRHQHSEFGPKPGEIFKNLQKSTLAFNGGSNSNLHHFLCQTEFHPVLTRLSFFLSASAAATYIFTAPTLYNYYSYLEPCALDAEFHHFIPRFNIIPYFADLTQRGDRG